MFTVSFLSPNYAGPSSGMRYFVSATYQLVFCGIFCAWT